MPLINYMIQNGTDITQPIDSIFTLNHGVVDVQTTISTKIGTYKFKITCCWAETSSYKIIFYTTVNVLNQCYKNIIGSV